MSRGIPRWSGIGILFVAVLAIPTSASATSLPGHALGSNELVPPVIQSAPSVIGYGSTDQISTPDAAEVTRVFLVPGSSELLLDGGPPVALPIADRGQGWLSASEPESPDTVAPGSYLLFIEKPGLLTPLPSAPWPVTLRAPPGASSSPSTTPAQAGSTVGTSTSPADSSSGRSDAGGGGSTTASVMSNPRSQGRTGSKPKTPRGGPEAFPAKETSGRSPLAGLPLVPLVVAAFALVAWRLMRISEPVERGDRK